MVTNQAIYNHTSQYKGKWITENHTMKSSFSQGQFCQKDLIICNYLVVLCHFGSSLLLWMSKPEVWRANFLSFSCAYLKSQGRESCNKWRTKLAKNYKQHELGFVVQQKWRHFWHQVCADAFPIKPTTLNSLGREKGEVNSFLDFNGYYFLLALYSPSVEIHGGNTWLPMRQGKRKKTLFFTQESSQVSNADYRVHTAMMEEQKKKEWGWKTRKACQKSLMWNLSRLPLSVYHFLSLHALASCFYMLPFLFLVMP